MFSLSKLDLTYKNCGHLIKLPLGKYANLHVISDNYKYSIVNIHTYTSFKENFIAK